MQQERRVSTAFQSAELRNGQKAFRLLEFCSRSRGAGVNTNGQYDSDRVGERGQIHACALCLECENVVAERRNLNLQAHAVDSPLKRKSSVGILFERTGRNRYGEGANLQGHVFRDRVSPIAVLTQGEGFVQIEARLWGAAVIPSFAKDEAKGAGGPTSERLPTAQSLVIATETGPAPAGKGEPVMAVSAPVLESIVYPETLPELTFAT